MLTTYGIIAILVILFVAVLAIGIVAWLLRSPSKPKSAPAKTEGKAEPIVQSFVSNDLKKRAFIVRQNKGGFKVVYQRYSNKVINRVGEVTGWQDLPEKPVADSLAGAVEKAKSWVHAEE